MLPQLLKETNSGFLSLCCSWDTQGQLLSGGENRAPGAWAGVKAEVSEVNRIPERRTPEGLAAVHSQSAEGNGSATTGERHPEAERPAVREDGRRPHWQQPCQEEGTSRPGC